MPSFLHPSLFWILGLPALGVVVIPVLIHLINMMRHRRVEWAAMEFLLVSQKKHRTWILLKQLLLLLLRMAAVAAVVLMVAQPRLSSQLGDLLGGTRTHYVVLLDDSFSMSDRWGDTDAFSEAKKVIGRIGSNAARQDRLQSFTLLRFSHAGQSGRATEADLLKEPVTSEFAEKLEQLLAKMKVTETAVGPEPSLQAITQLLDEAAGEQRMIYLISDFRTRQWNDPADLRKRLTELGEAGAEVHLVNCVDRTRSNLAIVSLTPAEGIRAAGVPWFMEVAVQNFGVAPVRNIPVTLGEDGHGRPAVTISEIGPGKVAKERFLVRFPSAGSHRITARLESDAVDADNYRYCAVDLPADVPALLVDGDSRGRDTKYLGIALSPGGPVKTGVRPQAETIRYLTLKPLAGFQSVNLANFDRLDASGIEALEKYVAAGGGVAFFLGPRTDPAFMNRALYRDGKGIFPVPLAREMELPINRLEPEPDVQVDEHFIFRVFTAKRNTFLQTVAVQKYLAVPEGWRPANDSGLRVLAHLRNGAPLVVEKSFGRGKVIAFLTTAAPTWNNWARNPSFVVIMQDLQAYLAQRSDGDALRLVGSPLDLQWDPAEYQPQVRLTPPAESGALPTAINATLADGQLTAVFPDTDASGFYDVQLTRLNGSAKTRGYAVNVNVVEGDLTALNGQQLASRLQGVKYRYDQAASFESILSETTSSNLGELILYGLLLLLVVEQILAWSASYHISSRGRRLEGAPA